MSSMRAITSRRLRLSLLTGNISRVRRVLNTRRRNQDGRLRSRRPDPAARPPRSHCALGSGSPRRRCRPVILGHCIPVRMQHRTLFVRWLTDATNNHPAQNDVLSQELVVSGTVFSFFLQLISITRRQKRKAEEVWSVCGATASRWMDLCRSPSTLIDRPFYTR